MDLWEKFIEGCKWYDGCKRIFRNTYNKNYLPIFTNIQPDVRTFTKDLD